MHPRQHKKLTWRRAARLMFDMCISLGEPLAHTNQTDNKDCPNITATVVHVLCSCRSIGRQMLDWQCAETMSLNLNKVILCYWFSISAAAAMSCLCCHVDIRHLFYLYCGVMLSLVRPFVQFCLICGDAADFTLYRLALQAKAVR